ncbi:uncharacterized protein LOC110693310 [Chenopodium quinoa]|uniref:uncharacterized protein LOC110693310 n=1 Tax=Chenopodium quinoa TaxID=63459 RepID=UPI000B775091|nr:uncharacterized protein LOC110693310 [Chenopodium quinoa]
MRDLYQSSPHPTLFGGDFNEILSADEKVGGALRDQRDMDAFREVLYVCSLRDLGYDGSWVTWERGNKQQGVVRERVDRYVACSRWCSWFDQARVFNLTKFRSDHVGIMLDTEAGVRKKREKQKRRFHFETCWLLAEGIEDVIKTTWSNSSHLNMPNKLLNIANDLTRWSKDAFENLGGKIEEAEEALKEAQKKASFQASFDACHKLEGLLDDLHDKNEAYWFLRSKVSEIKDGDRNAKYFHHKAAQRRSKNFI